MRAIVVTRMPVLSAQIHRLVNPEDEDDSAPPLHSDWNWDGAERRMQEAYEKGGILDWAEVALKEVEAEGRLERVRRQAIEQEAMSTDIDGANRS